MRKKIIVAIICICFVIVAVNLAKKDIWEVNAKSFAKELDELKETSQQVKIADVTPFEWDYLYTFAPYSTKEFIYKTVGYKWDHISMTVDESMNQVVFMKDGKVVCYVYRYPTNIGFGIHFDTLGYEVGVREISVNDEVMFEISSSEGVVFLNEVKKPIDDDEKYKIAIHYIEERRYPQAVGILKDIEYYKQAVDLIDQLQYIMNGSFIANGIWAVGAITEDGGVQVAYSGDDNNPYVGVDSWKDIKSLSFYGGDSIEGLTTEGNIITTSTVTEEGLKKSPNIWAGYMANVVKAVSNWENIEEFQSYYPMSAIALDETGYVYAAYANYEDDTQPFIKWNEIVAIADGRSYAAGLKEDGTVTTHNFDYTGVLDTSIWEDIVAISASNSLIGLKEDGTVVSTGLNIHGEGNVLDWKDIIAISTCGSYTLGLRNDGTVVVSGESPYGAMEVTEWTDIIAIKAGSYFSIGLKSDGTIVLVGDSSYSGVDTPDVSGMMKLYVPTISLSKSRLVN